MRGFAGCSLWKNKGGQDAYNAAGYSRRRIVSVSCTAQPLA